MCYFQLPAEYLFTSSQHSLEAFEVSRLTCSSNLRKEICQVLDEWVTAEVDARLSRWILDYRRTQEAYSHPSFPERDEHIGSEYLTMRFLLTQDELPRPAVLFSGSMISIQHLPFPRISRPHGERSLVFNRSVSLVSYNRSGSMKSVLALSGSSQRTGRLSSKTGLRSKLAGAALRLLEYPSDCARTLDGCSGNSSVALHGEFVRQLPISFPPSPRSMYSNRSADTSANRNCGRACSEVLRGIRPPQHDHIPFRPLAQYQFSMAAAS
jgi:hypothetical protein